MPFSKEEMFHQRVKNRLKRKHVQPGSNNIINAPIVKRERLVPPYRCMKLRLNKKLTEAHKKDGSRFQYLYLVPTFSFWKCYNNSTGLKNL